MTSFNFVAIAAIVLFLNLVFANPLPISEDASATQILRARADEPSLPETGYMQLAIPPSDTTQTQVRTTAGAGGLGAYAILNDGGSIFLVVEVDEDYTADDFDSFSGYRITVQCHDTVFQFEQPHDLLFRPRRSLWARVSAKQLDLWREEYESNEDSDIDITIWWKKDNAYDDD
ncbi:hypothetical protein CGCTS75_v006292 [Colletotrichum tropicale]|nr:hypothetical protein CGCTS75_v006292 [Colletotrichum tropicale]